MRIWPLFRDFIRHLRIALISEAFVCSKGKFKLQIDHMATNPPLPIHPINLIELPQPSGYLRFARIDKLLTFDQPQISLLTLSEIRHLLAEIEEYNDVKLNKIKEKLTREIKIQEIAVLTLKEILTFNLREIQQTQAIVEWLNDQRLKQQKGLLRFARYHHQRDKQMKKQPPTFLQSFKEIFDFSFLDPKKQIQKEEEQQQQLSYDLQRQVGLNKFNFKYD